MKKFNLLVLFVTLLVLDNALNKPDFGKCMKKRMPNKAIPNLREYPSDDITSQNIRDNIYKYAKHLMKHSDLKIKKIMNGILPDGYSQEMKKRALKIRNNRKNWESLMKNPTELWGFCVYPKYKVNAMAWCDEIYSIKNKEKVEDCKNSFCNVCCDHFPNIFKSLTGNKIGKKLMLNKKSGNSRIKRVATDAEVDKCRYECKRVYPVHKPMIYPPPPRDSNLGKTQENSAKSCADIKKWGEQDSPSGEYWIDLGAKGKVVAYCDMKIDKGGWTLFFNYVHKASQEIFIDSSKLPKNIQENSHINIRDIGIEESNILELRFLCTEKSRYKYYMHFKINNKELIRTAYTGDQSQLMTSNFSSGFNDLPYPGDSESWIRVFDKNNISQVDMVGTSKNGGFWNTPFGSFAKKKFWTVKTGRFECGTYHKDILDNTQANLVASHHTIWFRGPPPTDEVARIRYMSRNFSK